MTAACLLLYSTDQGMRDWREGKTSAKTGLSSLFFCPFLRDMLRLTSILNGSPEAAILPALIQIQLFPRPGIKTKRRVP